MFISVLREGFSDIVPGIIIVSGCSGCHSFLTSHSLVIIVLSNHNSGLSGIIFLILNVPKKIFLVSENKSVTTSKIIFYHGEEVFKFSY